jgi:hypothetical protein
MALGIAAAVGPLPGPNSSAAAQPGGAPQTPELQWAGCWELQGARADDAGVDAVANAAAEDPGSRQVCIEVDSSQLTVATLVDDIEVRTDQLRTDGTPRQVEDGGCRGTENAVMSADRHRLYTTADLVCEGGTRRQASGISALVSPDTWVDIQVVIVEGERELMVRRFNFDAVASRAILTDGEGADLLLAARSARTAAAALVDTDDVIEAAAVVDAAAVEALLLETNAAFAMDVHALIALADADVPDEVIDLMVALSFPDYFLVNEDPSASDQRGGFAYPVRYYGYWTPAFAPFGWGYSYYPYYSTYPGYGGGGPGVIYPPGYGRYGGKVVSGRGYARVAANPKAPEGGFSKFLRDGGSSKGSRGGSSSVGGSSGSGGQATKSGSTSGSKSGKRTAKRRDG